MATMYDASRATMPSINNNIRVGKRKLPALSTTEQANVRKAITALQNANNATDINSAVLNLSTAFQLTRTIILANK